MDNAALSTPNPPQVTLEPTEFAYQIAELADERKSFRLRLYHVSELCSYADYILLCSGSSERHVQAIAETIRTGSKKRGVPVLGTEGLNQGNWVLIDLGEMVVHVFYDPAREYYDVDRLWGSAPRVELPFTPADEDEPAFGANDDDDFDDDY